jgi:HK97 family phage portal protein
MPTIFSRLRNRRVSVSCGPRATEVLGKTPAEMYRTQPALRSVVEFIAKNVAAVPLKCYERRGENDRPRDTTSAIATLLESPGGGVTTFELIRDTTSDVLLYGWALWYVALDADTESGWSITRVPPEWVQQTYTDDGWSPSRYVVAVPYDGRAPISVTSDETIRFALYAGDDPVNTASPVEALKQVLSEQVSAWDYRNKVWRNGGWISRWISRDKDAPWTPDARDRFARSWKARFSGKDGTDTGGTPLLEDGMQLHDTTMNAREAQFSEATTLSREDVAAVYGINPSLIWHTDTQTYASAKDNARALYSETLAPTFDLICERINKVLIPRMGLEGRYVEFDTLSKLNSNPADMLATLVSATGRPVMLADEARKMLNLPAIGGSAAELVTPLNVLVGSDSVTSGAQGGGGEASGTPLEKSVEPVKRKSSAKADAQGSADISALLAKFFRRQAKAVLPKLDSAKARGALAKADGDEAPEWWDAERWDRELGDDLEPVMARLVTGSATGTLEDVGLDPGDYDESRTKAWIAALALNRAKAVNAVTLRELERALGLDADDVDEGVQGDTPQGVFDKAEESRASGSGFAIACACAVWGQMEAVGQCAPASRYERRKTWRHGGSHDPRSEHLAMDGETVDYDKTFSNGMRWPHDSRASVLDNAYCSCSTEITIWEK